MKCSAMMNNIRNHLIRKGKNMKNNLFLLSLYATALLLVIGCKVPLEPGTVELQSIANLNGSVASSNGAINLPMVGDTDFGVQGNVYRSFYSFALSGIPSGATITNDRLQLYLALNSGNPFTNHGNVIVDSVDYGNSLDGADFNCPTLQSNIGTIADNGTVEYKSLNVTSSVLDDMSNSRTYSQFRLRFSLLESDTDSESEFVEFTDAKDSFFHINKPPKMVVDYK
jgi:hypothetical protein